MISSEYLSVEITDLCIIQHHNILWMWVQNTGISHYICRYWKHYLALLFPTGVCWYVPQGPPFFVESQAVQGILARLAQCPPFSVRRNNAFITRIHTEIHNINLAASDIQVDTMDIYHKFKRANDFKQVVEGFSGFHFLIKEGCQIFEGKNSNHIINESDNTDTHAFGICWFEWMLFKDEMNFIDDCVNINTLFIDEFWTLEKRNSDASWNWTNIWLDKLRLKKHTHKSTHAFIFL